MEGNKALLISKYGLDCQRYNSKYEEVTWETCTLRGWLNRDFLNAAFSDSEKKFITETEIDNSNSQGNPVWSWASEGNNTTDRFFLPSYAEARDYFVDDVQRVCRPTEYALSQGVYSDKTGNCLWWLRSSHRNQDHAAIVYTDGSLGNFGNVGNISDAVRPAFWINLEALSS